MSENIKLRDINGDYVTYEGIDTIVVKTVDDEDAVFNLNGTLTTCNLNLDISVMGGWDGHNILVVYNDIYNNTIHMHIPSTESEKTLNLTNIPIGSDVSLFMNNCGYESTADIDISGASWVFGPVNYYNFNSLFITVNSANASGYIEFDASCFLPDTLITLADGTKKQIKDITYSDKLKVWNFDEGKYDESSICWLTRSGLKNHHYYKLTFSDGTTLCTTGRNSNHRVYNADDRLFDGVASIEIGKRVFTENGIVTLTNKEYIEEEIEYYNLITEYTFGCFANGVLTSDRYGNTYPISEDMKFIKDGRQVRPYSEFEAVGISRYWYNALRLGEQTESLESTKKYIRKLELQMLPR